MTIKTSVLILRGSLNVLSLGFSHAEACHASSCNGILPRRFNTDPGNLSRRNAGSHVLSLRLSAQNTVRPASTHRSLRFSELLFLVCRKEIRLWRTY